MKKILEYTDGDWKRTFVLDNDVFSILCKNTKSKNSDDIVFEDKVFGKGRGNEFGIRVMKGNVNMFLDRVLEDHKEKINDARLKKEGKGGLNVKCTKCKKKLKNYNDYFWISFDEMRGRRSSGKRSFGVHLVDMTTTKFPKEDVLLCTDCWPDEKYYKRASNNRSWRFKNKQIKIPKRIKDCKAYLFEKLEIK